MNRPIAARNIGIMLLHNTLDGWMFRDTKGNLVGPFADRDAAYAALLLVYGHHCAPGSAHVFATTDETWSH